MVDLRSTRMYDDYPFDEMNLIINRERIWNIQLELSSKYIFQILPKLFQYI